MTKPDTVAIAPRAGDLERTMAAAGAERLTGEFYTALRREVIEGNPRLGEGEQRQLRSHYPVMMRPEHYPPSLVTTIYTARRAPAVRAILGEEAPRVFDAGCGYGSESFLFAAAGARVLAVDLSPEKIAIACKRRAHYEALFGKPLEVSFVAADLDVYDPTKRGLSLTWLASVLAAVPDQEGLLHRLYAATRRGGLVMISDMNLLNPLFLLNEWRRRRRAAADNPEFVRRADFPAMFFRHRRCGARYFSGLADETFDDAQFFWWKTLAALFRKTGFEPLGSPCYSGLVPPWSGGPDLSWLESLLSRIPILRTGGYFYLMTGVKPPGDGADP